MSQRGRSGDGGRSSEDDNNTYDDSEDQDYSDTQSTLSTMCHTLASTATGSTAYPYEPCSSADLVQELVEALDYVPHLSEATKAAYLGKLQGYRHIDDVPKIRERRAVKWMYRYREDDVRLKTGMLWKPLFRDGGMNLQMRGIGRNNAVYYEIKFDETLVFLKLNTDEMLLVMAEDYLLAHASGSEDDDDDTDEDEKTEEDER